jgi:hypothetical protein
LVMVASYIGSGFSGICLLQTPLRANPVN